MPTPAGPVLFSSKGQIALIFIIIIAIVFIFFAIVLNLGKMAQLKTMTTVAANVGTAMMASQLTSYAEMFYQNTLGGPEKAGNDLTVCGWTGIASAIIAIIVAIIAIASGQISLLLFVVAVLLSAASIALEATIVNPGVTDLWNKQMASLDRPDQFAEQGLQVALNNVINDPVTVLDNVDLDLDGLYTSAHHTTYLDEVSRFSFYYQRRLSALQARRPPKDKLFAFLKALEQFVHNGNIRYLEGAETRESTKDSWGLWDPVDCSYENPTHTCCQSDPPHPLPSICNPCCLPNGKDAAGNPTGEPNYRPKCCDSTDPLLPSCGTSTTCPYNIPTSPGFPYVYDSFFEDGTNPFVSFREAFGHDDQSKSMQTNPPKNYIPNQVDDPTHQYRPEDALGIFPFLWKVTQDVDLPVIDPFNPFHKIWCDMCQLRGSTDPSCDPSAAQLHLTETCSGVGCCLSEKTDRVTNAFYLSGSPSTQIPMLIPPGECYQISQGWWKEGVDDFCTTVWPYGVNCPGKHCDSSCTSPYPSCELAVPSGATSCEPDSFCGSPTDPSLWPEDDFDEKDQEMKNFLIWAKDTLDKGVTGLAAEFTLWYPGMKSWLGTPAGTVPGGKLSEWQNMMKNGWQKGFRDWQAFDQYLGQACDDVCFPQPGCPDEKATVTISDVVACLNTSATKKDAEKVVLKGCYDFCSTNPDLTPSLNIILTAAPAAPLTVKPGEAISGSWSISSGTPTSLDWIALFEQGASNSDWVGKPGGWFYNSGASASGTFSFVAPASAGAYEVRYLPNDGYTAAGSSNPVTVTGVGTLGISATDITVGGSVTVTWNMDPLLVTVTGLDWIGLYRAGEPNTNYLASFPTGGVPSGTVVVTSPYTDTVGQYEFRYLYNNGYTSLTVSPFLVIRNPLDNTPPVISNVQVTRIRDTEATITWQTDEIATSRVDFGQTPAYGSSVSDATFKVNHFILLTGLTAETTYHFQVASQDFVGNPEARVGGFSFVTQASLASKCPVPPVPPMNNPVVDCKAGSSYLQNTLWPAYQEAVNAADKYRFRGQFLSDTMTETTTLFTDPNPSFSLMGEAVDKIETFINSSAVKDLDAVYSNLQTVNGNSSILPTYVVYGWKSPPPRGSDKGYWHLVRADVRTLGRCGGQCGRIVGGSMRPEPGWPWVKSYTRHWGTRRCYTLGDSFDYYPNGTPNGDCDETGDYANNVSGCFRGGTTKTRVIRYDEDKDVLLRFSNNIPLWRTLYQHPLRSGDQGGLLAALESACNPKDAAGIGPEAFMLNNRDTASPQCWDAAARLLERGVMSQSCAEYFFHQRSPYGFDVKFVPCSDPIKEPLR